MSRYDWSKVPEWAQFVGTDDDGCVFAFEHEPVFVGSAGEWCSVTGRIDGVFRPEWYGRSSLEKRPESAS